MSTADFSIHGLDHVQIAIPAGQDVVAREFYAGVLGLPEVPVPANLAHLAAMWFERGNLRLHLGVTTEFQPARKAHPALLVTGLAALAQRLREAGVAIVSADPLEGYNRFFVFDPFGNRIEFLEPISRGK